MPKKRSNSNRTPWLAWLLPISLVIAFFGMRAPGLGRYVTTDEALWLRRSANFYVAINNGDWASTFQTEHPGIVTQWAGAIGFWLKFPEYGHVGPADVHDAELVRLMENRGVSPMEVLAAGRLVLVLLHTVAFAALWPFARRRLGATAAALGMALIAFDPFLIAHQRLLHLDGLLASLMLLAVLAFWDFLETRRTSALVISAIATGLTMLTKTPGWFLLPFAGLLMVWKLWKNLPLPARSAGTLPLAKGKGRGWGLLIAYAIWALLALLILFALFPALWIAPLQTLQQMFAYALGSAKGEFSGSLFFNGAIYPDGNFGAASLIFYPIAFLWRSTPLTLVGLIVTIYSLVRRPTVQRQSVKRPNVQSQASVILPLAIFSILFMAFMTLGDKKFDRYLLPALPPLLLIAGWGWAQLAQALPALRKPAWRGTALLAGAAVLQLVSALPTYPYYLSYYNPLMGGSQAAPQVMQIGWGEGLDVAANYLKQQNTNSVGAWYSTSFNLMFNSQADDIPVATRLGQGQLDDLLRDDYLVIYVHEWQRGTPQNLLDALKDLQPEYRVVINGIEYVRVYHLVH